MNFINFILERFTNSGTKRDVRLDGEPHRVKYKLIEVPFHIASAAIEYVQQFAKSQNWIGNRGIVADQNSSNTIGDARLPEPGTAINFDGTQYIDAGQLPAFGGTMSGSIWFKFQPGASPGATAGLFAAYSVTPDPDRGLRFYIDTANGQILGYFSDDGATAVQIAGNASTPAMPSHFHYGRWHHFAFSFVEGAWKFYLDGMLQATQTTVQTSIRVPTTPLLIGTDFDGQNPWHGQLFDFKLFDTLITPSQVWAMWQQGKQPWKVVTGQPSNPVIEFPLSNRSNKVALASQGMGEDKYAATKPFTDDNWIISNPSGAGFVDGEVQLSGAYVSLRPTSAENQILRGGATYFVTIVVRDWNGGHIQARPYVGNTTTNIVALRNYSTAQVGPVTITGTVTMPLVDGLNGYINLQSNSGGSTREFTVVDFKVQEMVDVHAASANIINGSDETVYYGTDVPYNQGNLTGATKHCRFNYGSSNFMRWTLQNFDVPDRFSWRFVSTVERFSAPSLHINTLVSIGYISPYWIGYYNEENFRVIYKDVSNQQQVISATGDMVWETGVEYDITVSFDTIASTITITEANTGQSHVHNMPNGLLQTFGGVNNIGGYGSGGAAGANFDGSIDLVEYKVNDVLKMKLDWRQDGLSSAIDPKVATVGFPTFFSTSLPEIITTPAKPSDLTKDSYAGSSVQHAGLCPKQGQLVNSSCGTFDGNDYVDTPLGFDDWTQVSCSAWVRLTNAASYPMVFGTGTANQGFELKMNQSNRQPQFTIKAGAWANATTTERVVLDTWHHVAGTYDGSKIKLYLDNQLVAEAAADNLNFSHPTQTVNIGARPAFYWYGQIMDARVYDRGLSSAEVADIYAGNGTNTNLQGHWPFTETGRDIVHDVSGNGKHGTATNISEENFWGTKQDRFHHNVEKGCDVVCHFPTPGGLGKFPTCPQPTGSSSCYSLWFNSQNNSATSNLFRNGGIACTILPNNLRFTYASKIDYHFHTYGPMAENEWHHIVISVDDNDASLWVNGVFSETITYTQNPNQGGTIFLGGYGTLGGLFQAAEFVVLDRPVAGQAEVTSLYNGGVPSDALAAYKLDGNLTDSTGNTSPVSNGNQTFIEVPATNAGGSLFRPVLSNPAGVGLNSIVTQIDPTPEPNASYLHSGIGHLSCAGATTVPTRPYTGALPNYIPNMDYATGFTVNLWARNLAYSGGILGGHGNNYFKVNATNTIYVRGSHSPNNVKFADTAASMNGLGQWNHFVLRFDGSKPLAEKYTLFVNGVACSAQTLLTNVPVANYFAIDRIGRYGISGPILNGDVKDVRMYSEVFSDNQCQAMYAGTYPTTQNEEANWPLGSHFGDISGNERNLVIRDGGIPAVINPANFGGQTYLGEALFDRGDYAILNWVWNVNNQLNEGFDISFTMSTNGTTAWGQGVLWGGNGQPVFYIRTDGSLRVYLDQFTAATVAQGLDDGVRRRIRVVLEQDNGGMSTLQAYVDGVAQAPATVATVMPAQNTAQATIGLFSTTNSFAGTLSDLSISLNGGSAYQFPLATDANSTNGQYTATYASLNNKPLFRAYDSTNLILGGTRQEPSSVNSTANLDSNYKTKGH